MSEKNPKEKLDAAVSTLSQEEEDAAIDTHRETDAGTEPAEDGAQADKGDEDAYLILQRSYDELKQRAAQEREEAEKYKRELEQARQDANIYRRQYEASTQEARSASAAAIESAIAHTKNNIVTLKAEIARAAKEEDWDAFSEAQDALTQNNIHLTNLTKEKNGGSGNSNGSIPSSSEIEKFISTLSPQSQQWIRKHQQDIFSSPSRQERAQRGHVRAVEDGIGVDTQEYFDALDAYMGYTKKPEQTDMKTAPDDQPQRQNPSPARSQPSVPSAPPARTVPGMSSRANEVRLTREQQEAALEIYAELPREEALKKYAEGVKQIRSGNTHLRFSSDKYGRDFNGA